MELNPDREIFGRYRVERISELSFLLFFCIIVQADNEYDVTENSEQGAPNSKNVSSFQFLSIVAALVLNHDALEFSLSVAYALIQLFKLKIQKFSHI